MRSLIVGDGYLAATLVDPLRRSGVSVERAPCPGRPELDRLLAAERVDQVVLASEARERRADAFVAHVDGPRWMVFSRAGRVDDCALDDAVLERGGTVLRLSAVFGRGGDDNVTRMARCVQRYRGLIGVENGKRLVQPLHIDDLVALVGLHLRRPSSGCFEIAGPEAVPVAELWQSIVEIVGTPPIGRVIAPLARVLDGRGIGSRAAANWRAEQTRVNPHPARAQFGWSPLALGIRVEQAVHEALA